MNAFCNGWRSGPRRSPATVSTDLPAQVSASVTQDTRGTPSISTVQVPHVPCQQPPFTDRSPTDSRNTSSRLAPPSAKVATSSPLRPNWIGVFIATSCVARAEQHPAQINRKDFVAPPGAGDGVVGRRGPVGGNGERRSDARGI